MKQQTTLTKMLHLDKVESFLLLEGRVMYSIYNSEGEILDQVDMVGLNNINQSRNPCFYIRIGKEVVHKPQVTSLAALAKETTTGPFRPELTTIIA
jgi:cupin fold WbuC family metalloprotein